MQPRPAHETAGGLQARWPTTAPRLPTPTFACRMLFNTIFGTGQFFAAPFFNVYALRNLHFNYVWPQIFATITSVASLASMPMWGWLAQNRQQAVAGHRNLRRLHVTLHLDPGQPGPPYHGDPADDLVGPGRRAVLGRLVRRSSTCSSASARRRRPPSTWRPWAVTGLMGGLAPLVGSAVMRGLSGWSGHLFHLTLLNYHVQVSFWPTLRSSPCRFAAPGRYAGGRHTRCIAAVGSRRSALMAQPPAFAAAGRRGVEAAHHPGTRRGPDTAGSRRTGERTCGPQPGGAGGGGASVGRDRGPGCRRCPDCRAARPRPVLPPRGPRRRLPLSATAAPTAR